MTWSGTWRPLALCSVIFSVCLWSSSSHSGCCISGHFVCIPSRKKQKGQKTNSFIPTESVFFRTQEDECFMWSPVLYVKSHAVDVCLRALAVSNVLGRVANQVCWAGKLPPWMRSGPICRERGRGEWALSRTLGATTLLVLHSLIELVCFLLQLGCSFCVVC